MAVAAGVVIMLVVLIVVRQRLTGRTGIEVDVLPGRLGAGRAPGVPVTDDTPADGATIMPVTDADTPDAGSFDRRSNTDS